MYTAISALLNAMMGVGIFGGIVLGIIMIPYAIALVSDDMYSKSSVEANTWLPMTFSLCVIAGAIGALGLWLLP